MGYLSLSLSPTMATAAGAAAIAGPCCRFSSRCLQHIELVIVAVVY